MDRRIQKSRKILEDPYAHLSGEGEFEAILPEEQARNEATLRNLENPYACIDGVVEFRATGSTIVRDRVERKSILDLESIVPHSRRNQRHRRQEIESAARELHLRLWRRRSDIWPDREIERPEDVLDPLVALECSGYDLPWQSSLGHYATIDGEIEVAGMLDRDNSAVFISEHFSKVVQNYTAAHELGHAILHTGTGMHRDRALDGSARPRRSTEEMEADAFAACFLIPEKLVRTQFRRRFGTDRFRLNEDTAFALVNESLESLHASCRTFDDLALLLAGVCSYDGTHFCPMTEEFCVSAMAMAIRIKELSLAIA